MLTSINLFKLEEEKIQVIRSFNCKETISCNILLKVSLYLIFYDLRCYFHSLPNVLVQTQFNITNIIGDPKVVEWSMLKTGDQEICCSDLAQGKKLIFRF